MSWIEDNISAYELIEWLAYYEYIEPFGGRLLDEQRSVLSLQNYQGECKPTIKDFQLYDYSMQTPEQKEQERLSIAKLKERAQADELLGFFKSKAVKNNDN